MLFIPIFLELLLMNLLTSVDTLMLSNYDKLCVNAVGTSNSTLSLLTCLLIISSNGVSIIVGQFLGAKKDKDAKEILSQGVIFNFLLGIILFIVFFVFAGPLLRLVNTNDDFFELAKTYIKIYSFALPFQALNQVIAANFRAYGKPFYMTISSIASNVLNVFLNYLLIYGIWIFPEMGIKGAALATVISFIFKSVLAITLELKILKCPIIPRKADRFILTGIVKIGGPSALETVSYTLFSFILMAALNKLTNIEIGSRVYINLVLSYIMMFSSSLSNANAVLVARYVGAHKYKEAKMLTLKIASIGVSFVVVLVTLLNLFGRQIFMIITNDQDYVDVIIKVLPLIYILEIGRSINLIIISAQKSSGDVVFPLILGLSCMSIFMAGGAWIFAIGLKWALAGIILAQALDEFVRGIVSLTRWLTNGWMNHSLIKEEKVSK